MLLAKFDHVTVFAVAGPSREGGQSRGESVLIPAVLQGTGYGGSECSAVWPAFPICAGH